METVKVVAQKDGTFAVVTRRRGERSDVEFFETEAEAQAYREYLAETKGLTPLYWNERIAAYVTVPRD